VQAGPCAVEQVSLRDNLVRPLDERYEDIKGSATELDRYPAPL
jgi:hypothetical protein